MASGVAPGSGTLFVVATPIGNREDITLRALRTLRDVSVVAAENTRRARALLRYFEITTPVMSYREVNRERSIEAIVRRLDDQSVALISDAGMPGISDPGAELIAAVVARGGRVEVVPGANAALSALLLSALPPAPYTFRGFLSRQRGDRVRQLQEVAARHETLVLYEAPHRLLDTLRDLVDVLGNRPAAICRELTKLHEEVRRGLLSDLIDYFCATAPRGEFTVVVAGAPVDAGGTLSDTEIDERLLAALTARDDMKVAVAGLALDAHRPRREIYARWQLLRRDQADDPS